MTRSGKSQTRGHRKGTLTSLLVLLLPSKPVSETEKKTSCDLKMMNEGPLLNKLLHNPQLGGAFGNYEISLLLVAQLEIKGLNL